MDDEKLINCVKSYRGLYDFSHSQYLNGNYKEKKWDKIGVKLNQSGIIIIFFHDKF